MEQTELKDILEQHKLWLETNGMQGILAYLYGANLKDANLTGANLTGADLRRADLRDANLEGANLQGANLYGVKLTGAKLYGVNLTCANLRNADLRRADLTGANLRGANLTGAYLTDAILPDISWIIPGCLAHLNNISDELYLEKENKLVNFVQDSFGFFIQDNPKEGTFDMLVEDRIIRNIPYWVKYSGLKQIAAVIT